MTTINNAERIKKNIDKLRRYIKIFYLIGIALLIGLLSPRYDQGKILWNAWIIAVAVIPTYYLIKSFILFYFADPPPKKIQAQAVMGAAPVSPTQPNKLNKWLIVGFTIFVVSILALIAISVIRDQSNNGFSENRSKEIERTVIEINKVTTTLKVEAIGFDLFLSNRVNEVVPAYRQNFSQIYGKAQPTSQFIVTLIDPPEHPAYLFEKKQYTIETGGSIGRIPTSKICSFIEQQYDEKVPILEDIKNIPGDLSIKGWVNIPIAPFIVQLAYIIRKFSLLTNGRVEILIKGYADGQIADWDEPMKPGRYRYPNFPVFQAADPESQNPAQYTREVKTIFSNDFYKNKDLPNLRAKFVLEDLVNPFLSTCANSARIETSILDGHEFNTIHPPERKVEIYILLY